MSAQSKSSEWGRVDEDGNVYVRVGDREHLVGQYPVGSAAEALDFFTRRYDGLAFEVQLLEQRVRNGSLNPDEATAAVKKLADQLAAPNAVGDLQSLSVRLGALGPLIGLQREHRREDKARALEAAKTRKAEIVAEAEKLGAGRDWRNGANRLRDLLTEWKALPRLERRTDDELWHRFSAARTTYTKARKAHFAELGERRAESEVIKQRLCVEAEKLADSTDWAATSARLRSLMQQWKAAGAAPRERDDELWVRFRAAQDTFFGARDAANAEVDKEYAANAETKRGLLVEAEALLPVTDINAAKRSFRELSERWDAAGKVPREQVKDLEARMRKVEQAIRGVEEAHWRRSDPEKSARADDLVSKLDAAIAQLESDLSAARASGQTKQVADLEETLAGRRQFLELARKASDEFGG